ncbi:hypothetical protein B0H10DRAFT_1946292 [Mycena sp. CBHHK59/15]|nr:hypothetical protein B0H10DRAFT_1946292 [Mycena sp. CBHHK59/15]
MSACNTLVPSSATSATNSSKATKAKEKAWGQWQCNLTCWEILEMVGVVVAWRTGDGLLVKQRIGLAIKVRSVVVGMYPLLWATTLVMSTNTCVPEQIMLDPYGGTKSAQKAMFNMML